MACSRRGLTGSALGREQAVVGARRVLHELGELAGRLVPVAAPLPHPAEPVGGRVPQRLPAPYGLEPGPARGGLHVIAAEPGDPAEPPERAGPLVLVRVVGGQLHVGLLGLGRAGRGLEDIGLQQEGVRRVVALRMLAHQPVQRGQRSLAVAALAEAAQLEQPARAALGRRPGQSVGGGGQRGVVAAEPARGVHQHPQRALTRVGRRLLGDERLGLSAGPLDEPGGEQPLGARGPLHRARRGRGHAGIGQRLELALRRVPEGGGRLQPQRREHPRRFLLIARGQQRLTQRVARPRRIRRVGEARDHALQDGHRGGRIARLPEHHGRPHQGGGREPALRRGIRSLRGQRPRRDQISLPHHALGLEEPRVVRERAPRPRGIGELPGRGGPVARLVRGQAGREPLPCVRRERSRRRPHQREGDHARGRGHPSHAASVPAPGPPARLSPGGHTPGDQPFATRATASTLRSISGSVVAHDETLTRIAVRPCHTVPPHQHVSFLPSGPGSPRHTTCGPDPAV